MSVEQSYIDLYRQQAGTISAGCAEVLNDVRESAFAIFEKNGFPTKRLEKYKYTNAVDWFAHEYGLNLRRLRIPVNPYEAFRCDVPNLSTSLYFMVNDAFYNDTATVSSLPDHVLLGSLNAMASRYPDKVKPYYHRLAGADGDSITAFNTAFAQDGLFIYVPKNVRVERPIQLINLLRSDVDLMVNRRLLIVLEEGASLTLLTCDHTMDSHEFLATQVTEAYVGANAELNLYDLEEANMKTRRVSNLYIEQQADSRLQYDGITLTNGATCNRVNVMLAGQGATTEVSGMAIADKHQQVDNYTFIDHHVPECTSRELYKYVLDDHAIASFAGKVLVSPGAQHTDSQQTNRNLCLTKTAHMFTQPQLEIYADDVKCTHGATVGQLDEEALFYMQQRGISQSEARLLLMFSFVNEVIDQISLEALRDRLHYLVEKRFRGELDKCAGCRICK